MYKKAQMLPVITPGDWKVAQELWVVLKPFFVVTESISGEKYATAVSVIVLINDMFDICIKLKLRDFSDKVKEVVN